MFRLHPRVSAKATTSFESRAADVDSLRVRQGPHGPPGPEGSTARNAVPSSPLVFDRHSLRTDEETEAQRVRQAERRACLTLLQGAGTKGAFPRPLSVVCPPGAVQRLQGEVGLRRESSPLSLTPPRLSSGAGRERGWGATRRASPIDLLPPAEQGRVSPRLPPGRACLSGARNQLQLIEPHGGFGGWAPPPPPKCTPQALFSEICDLPVRNHL